MEAEGLVTGSERPAYRVALLSAPEVPHLP
jgi:hypothetical protein